MKIKETIAKANEKLPKSKIFKSIIGVLVLVGIIAIVYASIMVSGKKTQKYRVYDIYLNTTQKIEYTIYYYDDNIEQKIQKVSYYELDNVSIFLLNNSYYFKQMGRHVSGVYIVFESNRWQRLTNNYKISVTNNPK